MYRKTVIDISRLAAAVMLACIQMSVWATVSSPVGVVSGRQITVTGKPEIEYVRTQNSVQVKSLPTHNDPDNDLLSDWLYVWKIDGVEVKAEAGAGSATVVPVHPILQGEYNKPAQLCLKAVTATGYPESTRTSAETCSDEVQLTNSAPTASNVTVSGTLRVGQTLTASYDYVDGDGDGRGQTVRWYRSDDATGSNKAIITGATGESYTVVVEDENKYLSVAITPTSATGLSPGLAMESSLVGPISSRLLIERFSTAYVASMLWNTANTHCNNMNSGPNGGTWRLPTRDELVALYNENPNNTINTVHGWPIKNQSLWSSTASGAEGYFVVHFGSGIVNSAFSSTGKFYVTCINSI